jgi:hypothetical protein
LLLSFLFPLVLIMPTPKHIPLRQCIACRQRRPKRELLRIVIGEAGPVIDPTGRKPGRGAYVCPDKGECWNEKKLRRFAGAKAVELSMALLTLLGTGLTPPEANQQPKGMTLNK